MQANLCHFEERLLRDHMSLIVFKCESQDTHQTEAFYIEILGNRIEVYLDVSPG